MANPIQILYSGTPTNTPVLGVGPTDNNIGLNGPDGLLFWFDGTTTQSFDLNASGGIANVVEDTTPELGGDLDAGGFNISNTGLITTNLGSHLQLGQAALVRFRNNADDDWLHGMGTDGSGDNIVIANGGNGIIMGADLDVGGFSIVSVSNGDITLAPHGTGKVVISGDLDVTGTTTTINSTTLQVDDKNIELGTVDSPTDTTADGGGITLKGTTDKTILWDNTNDNWSFNKSVNISTGLDYKINNVSVVNATTLGASVVNSSLTSVGTIGTGTWQGSVIAQDYGGTGANLSALAANSLIKNNAGGTAFEAATAGTDYVGPNSLVGGQTF